MPIMVCTTCHIVFTARDAGAKQCGLCIRERRRLPGFTLGAGVAQYADTDGPLPTNIPTEDG